VNEDFRDLLRALVEAELIKNKQALGRPKDLLDPELLRR
jgi:hypothetical protein